MSLKTKEIDFGKDVGLCPECDQEGELKETDGADELFYCKNCNIEWVDFWNMEYVGHGIMKRNGEYV